MQQVKIFVDIESNYEGLEKRINDWIRESNAKVLHILGNIAPQTTTPDANGGAALGGSRFASSDLMMVVLFEA